MHSNSYLKILFFFRVFNSNSFDGRYKMKEAGSQTTSEDWEGPRVLSKTPLPEYEFPHILYRPHTVLWLLGALGSLFYFSQSEDYTSHRRQGAFAVIFILIFYSAVQLPSSRFMWRPHPALWRMLHGLGICYLCGLIFLLFQPVSEIRSILSWISPDLGVPQPERNYADDCRIYTPEDPHSSFAVVRATVLEVYSLAHVLGWFLKMIVIRDLKLCWFLSCFFEFLEISLRFQMPNFYECWWDSVVLDVLVCNAIGIYLGYLACTFCEMKEYYWGVGEDHRNSTGRFATLSRTALQFTPYSWSVYKWEMFASCKNFISTVWFIVFVTSVDLSNFYLKFVLWIPSSHWILLYRALFWAVFAVISTREYYGYVLTGFKSRLGSTCWLAHLILATEWLITLRNAEGLSFSLMPYWLQITWTGIIGLVIMVALSLFYKDIQKQLIK